MRPLKPPPDERDNWDFLNEGQRRYAWEQYNLALVRRGRSIDHPIPDIGEPTSGTDIDAILDRPHPDERGVASEIDRSIAEQEPDADDILGQLPDAVEDDLNDFDENYFDGDLEGDNHSRAPDMADSSFVTPTKDETGPPPPKRPKPGGSGSKLPGTAKGQGGNNLGEDSVRPFKLPKPTTSIHSHIRYYRKIHRFFTYGYAYKLLDNFPTNAYQAMTTPLALIPWDWAYFYLNPSEFNILPNQASIKHVKVKVYQRNVRVAFPTNSTANALATLNQNKNVIYAIGLNKRMDIVPGKYSTFQDTQPMIPTASSAWSMAQHRDDNNNWYGSVGNTPPGAQAVTPRHQFGQPDVLQQYAHVVYRKGGTHDGWECLQNSIEESDADATSGGLLVEAEYSPKVGVIKSPHRQINRAFTDGDHTIPRGSTNLSAHQTKVSITQTSGVSATSNSLQPLQANFTYSNAVQVIEKSQSVFEGLFQEPVPQAQPSLHVGVQPTYALTSTNVSVNNSFTDTQAMFEVVAECWVDTSYPTFRPLTTTPNVHITNFWSSNSSGGRFYGMPLMDGLYEYSAAPTLVSSNM